MAEKVTADDVHAAVGEQPLVGTKRAAEILGISAPNVSRLRTQGRMPHPVEVEGSAAVYVRSEVEALAKTLADERAARAAS